MEHFMRNILAFLLLFIATPALAYQPPCGASGATQYNNAGSCGAYTPSGDCTLVASTGVITCTKTNNVSFGTAATVNTGTSGATIPLLNGANSWSGTQTLASGGNLYVNGPWVETANFTANTSTSYAMNIDNGPAQILTITGAVAITLTTPTHPGKTILKLLEDGSGHVYSISGCKWPGGTAITYSTAANAYDIVSVWYDGTNFNCMGGAAFS